MTKEKNVAVLTGDIVNSSRLNTDELAFNREAIKNIVDDFKILYPGAIVGEVAFFRGDAWQLLLVEPKLLMRLLLFIAAGLKKYKVNSSRIGIGVGAVEHINTDNISLSGGEAFKESGRILNEIENMKVKKNKPFWRIDDKNFYKSFSYQLIASIAEDWTYAVARTIYEALKGKNQQEIADETNLARQTIAKNLRRGKWFLLEKMFCEE